MTTCTEAYLDIETTGLAFSGCDITVIGVHLCNGDESELVHLSDDLPTKRTEPTMHGLWTSWRPSRITDLIVADLGERDIAPAETVKPLQVLKVFTDRVTVF